MKCFSLLALVVCLAVVSELARASVVSKSGSHEWTLYKRKHGKSYSSPAEEAKRFANFLAAKERVERHNAQPGSSFKMGLNHLSDWHQEELDKLNGFRMDESTLALVAEHANSSETERYLEKVLGANYADEPVPKELDWRTVPGRVSSVKNQGKCGSCWAFSAMGGLEGQEATQNVTRRKEKGVVDLSEQELLDCSKSNFGCNGGNMNLAYEDIAKLGGAMTFEDYPYKAVAGECAFQKEKSVITDKGYAFLTAKDEDNLKQVLAKFGPIPIAMDATFMLMFYQSGILDDQVCSSVEETLNHAVLLVGYGVDPKQGDFWIVKNSWSEKWGEKGYFRIKRGVNMCGLALFPTVPKMT